VDADPSGGDRRLKAAEEELEAPPSMVHNNTKLHLTKEALEEKCVETTRVTLTSTRQKVGSKRRKVQWAS
jgi:hypothetical protein